MKRANTVIFISTFLLSVCSTAFAGVSLGEAYLKALDNDDTLKVAKYSYEAGVAGKGYARSGLLPSVSLNAKTTSYNTDRYGNYRTKDFDVALVQPIFNVGKYYSYKQSKDKVASEKARYDSAQLNLIVRLIQRYSDVLFAKDSVQLKKQEMEASKEQLKQAQKMFDSGLVAVTSVHEAMANLNMLRYEVISAESNYDNKLVLLESITGKLDSGLGCLDESFDFGSHKLAELGEWLDKVTTENKDVAYYKAMIEYSKRNVTISKSSFLPTADIFMNYNQTNSVNKVRSTDTLYKSVGARVNFPIFSGGGSYYKVKEAKSKYLQSVSDMNMRLTDAKSKTTEAYNNVTGLKSKIVALENLVKSNKLRLDSNEKSFEAGVSTIVDVMNARSNLFASMSKLTFAKYEYLNEFATLKYFSGTLSSEDVSFFDDNIISVCEEN